jgi:hypothetical protein
LARPPFHPKSTHVCDKQHKRGFQRVWLEEFKDWLRWDAAREAMFCTICERHEGRTAKGNNKVRPAPSFCLPACLPGCLCFVCRSGSVYPCFVGLVRCVGID